MLTRTRPNGRPPRQVTFRELLDMVATSPAIRKLGFGADPGMGAIAEAELRSRYRADDGFDVEAAITRARQAGTDLGSSS